MHPPEKRPEGIIKLYELLSLQTNLNLMIDTMESPLYKGFSVYSAPGMGAV